MTDDPRVEAVARALAEYDGQNPDAGVPNIDLTADPLWLRYEPRARAALAAADAAAWRPISEAPRNGTHFLALDEDGDMYRAAYDRGGYLMAFCGQPVVEAPEPTRFQYLTPPKEGS